MNYRHIYHAGNFADVFKHCILTEILVYLNQKEKPYFVLDTHAGIGLYTLKDSRMNKSCEYKEGVSKFLQSKGILEFTKYKDIVTKYISQYDAYPGSPMFFSELVRTIDRVNINELHTTDFQELKSLFRNNKNITALNSNGFNTTKALLPPKEKRGLVLIDPAFESIDEFKMIITALQNGINKFSNGIYMVWYPIKDQYQKNKFYKNIKNLKTRSNLQTLTIEIQTQQKMSTSLNACGVLIINPPWILENILRSKLPILLKSLELDKGSYSIIADNIRERVFSNS